MRANEILSYKEISMDGFIVNYSPNVSQQLYSLGRQVSDLVGLT